MTSQPKALVERVRTGFSTISMDEALRHAALANFERWVSDPRFEDTLEQIESLVEAGDFAALFDAFFRQIPFGTGGRRGPVGYGTNRFNRFTLSTSIQGHATFLKERFPDEKDLSVVVAYDVRVYNDLRGVYDKERVHPLMGMSSREFARLAASVYAANGIRVWMSDPDSGQFLSTPELSFAILRQKAFGGLNVSASHNPPDDNGAKIYNQRGGQEVPPIDEKLARIVEDTTVAQHLDFEAAVERGLICWLPPEVHQEYVAMNVGVSRDKSLRSARVVFTPLHGTGFDSAGAALQEAGFEVELYPAQGTPDGSFPNVPFQSPNPEVPQSLEGARDYARDRGADLVLGTDPDADRLGMMAPHDGEWVFFTGNEIGVILVNFLLSQGTSGRKHPFAVTTVVTTSLFSRIASAKGVQVVDDLGVGFKYIADVLNSIEASGEYGKLRGTTDDFVIAIEESHGYLVVPSVRDKDAAGAAVLLAELASQLKDEGRSFTDYLNGIYIEFGYVRNKLVSTVMQGAQGFVRMQKIQKSLRDVPPTEVAGRKVLEVTDRWDVNGPWGEFQSDTDQLSRDLLTYRLEGNARLTIRPSGTEPKNKIYIEVCGAPLGSDASAATLSAEKERIDQQVRDVAREFTKEMLRRINITIADYALEISDLVPLECKLDFAEEFMPAAIEKLTAGEATAAFESWVDQRLAAYGTDARLLVREAVGSYLDATETPGAVRATLEKVFALKTTARTT